MPKRKMTEQTISITIQGLNNVDLEDALDEVIRQIKQGYTSGMDGNDTGNYRFEIAENLVN